MGRESGWGASIAQCPGAQCPPWEFFFLFPKVELQLRELYNLLGGLAARFTKVPDPDAVKCRIIPKETDSLAS